MPDFVPCYPDFVEEQPDRETVAAALEQWAREWGRPVVADTHPGGCESTFGAMQAANVVVVPAVLAKEPLNALSGMVNEVSSHPLLITPNMVKAPPAWARRKFAEIVGRHGGFPTGPVIKEERWIENRRINVCISSEPVGKHARDFVASMDALVEAVINYG